MMTITPARRTVTGMPDLTTTALARCPVCGAERVLHFNGGELDAWSCHGHHFTLEHGPIYLAHYPPAEP